MADKDILELDTLKVSVEAGEAVSTYYPLTGARYYVTSFTAGTLQVSDDGTNFEDAGTLPDLTATAYRFVRLNGSGGDIYLRAI